MPISPQLLGFESQESLANFIDIYQEYQADNQEVIKRLIEFKKFLQHPLFLDLKAIQPKLADGKFSGLVNKIWLPKKRLR